MKRMLWVLSFFWVFAVQAAEQKPHDVALDFDGVQVSQVLRVVFGEMLRTPYVMDPAVLQDQRAVSFRWSSRKGEVRPFLRSFLSSLGYSIELREGVDFVAPVKSQDEVRQEDREVFVYRPLYRDGSFLVDLLGPLFKGSFTVRRSVSVPAGDRAPAQAVPSGSAAAMMDRSADILVFHGVEAEIQGLKKVLAQVDTAQGEILVKGVLYEVQTSKSDGSAFQLAASLLSGKVEIGLGPVSTLENAIKLKIGDWSAVLSALSTDSRFKVMSSPSARVRSGARARFVVGQDVPILGALSYPDGAGQAVQSVEYRSSGTIFELQPEVRDRGIDLQINQQLSNFVETSTGVNSSPTLIKRELSTSVTAEDGDVILLGGLTDSKDNEAASGLSFLPAFMTSKSGDSARTEILLVLSVKRL